MFDWLKNVQQQKYTSDKDVRKQKRNERGYKGKPRNQPSYKLGDKPKIIFH